MKISKALLRITCLLTLSVIGFGGMEMMNMMNMQQCFASESWDCGCGKKGLTSKFCTECGSKRPDNGTSAPVTQQPGNTKPNVDPARMRMVDGPGMANVNAWKHDVLNGGWVTPKGDLNLEIKGFDFNFGIYKAGEPDNFRHHIGRFYFAGWQRSQDREERYDLCLSEDNTIKDAEGNALVTLEEMWHEGKSIYMKVKYPNSEELIVRELRKAQDIAE